MKQTRTSLNSQIRQLSACPSVSDESINFHRVIAKQQEVISSLQQEILMLKSYITLHKTTLFQPICAQNSTISTNSSNDTLSKELEESLTHGYRQYQKITKEVVALLELKEGTELDDPQVLDAIKQLKESATRKKEPIFVERIKQIKVPITVEKIIEKPVEKIVQKVVYIDRPSFKERGGERDKYSRQYQNEEHEQEAVLNKTYSERNLNKSMVYQEKYQEKVKYEQYKRTEGGIGNGLIKKRTQNRNFTRKDYY